MFCGCHERSSSVIMDVIIALMPIFIVFAVMLGLMITVSLLPEAFAVIDTTDCKLDLGYNNTGVNVVQQYPPNTDAGKCFYFLVDKQHDEFWGMILLDSTIVMVFLSLVVLFYSNKRRGRN